ncbi:toll/interleukin-1 receptor (TIR) domain-containing protein [Artemisia annua]|uniref:Toll/interleukin-1 receptor (TIR) domain-containing protein n=1 Tax=Artemisia annua TaxID=35608 RepID=A0A2U1NQP4_ARTAN|nr:toll/interleukin-1 receptor (TIR) domain-containing protein [Artemisia annua]
MSTDRWIIDSNGQQLLKYDVFLSFRGEDTRKSFVDHLYHALHQKGVETYKDDTKIRKGKTISHELIQAIEDSKFYIIVFSKNYASSSWCLEELVKIMECQKMTDQHTAYHVFFDVEPTEVRNQNGAVEAAFSKYEKNESAGKWREALRNAADLAGWELKNILDGGEDTRKSFVDHLYHALHQKGVETYKDDTKIRKGKTISHELIQAIEDSKFYIIVFSKNYASSSWCLEELVKIMECQKMTDQHTAYHVFFDVEPTEVRNQNGAVEAAFSKYEKNESAGKWREALRNAADLAGWELKNILDGHEAKLIQKIVEEISLELRFINSGVDENLIGMKTRIDDVVSSLELGFDDVRMIGIKGMGGAGKTTLARAVYDHISFQFEGCSFVENVREESKPSMSGLKLLQKQVLSDVLSDQGISVSGVLEGKSMLKKKMCGKKVLIVLDDVDKIEQLVALAGDRSWFKPGSRIIITTRDAQVLIGHKVNLIRDVHLLMDKEAMCLFSRHAFGREIPNEGYKELSEQVVSYAAGLPLTIRVLGSFLCGKDDLDWKDALERLETIPLNETMKVLELSYIGLEEDYKEIFLDVACILKGWRKENAIRALESCGFRARNGLRVLELKSLITTSEVGHLWMHDHIEEMGKNIVRRLSPNEPKRHSRLWINEEIVDILANDSGTQATKCITLNAYGLNFEILMNGLTNMKELRFLYVDAEYVREDKVSKWNFDEVSLHLPNALRFLSWENYPFSSLPKTFQAKDLVGLEMQHSNIVQLLKDGEEKVFLKLRFLKFRDSYIRTLDLGLAPNLEMLHLKNCYNLVKIKLITHNLKELHLESCDNLEELHMPAESPKLRSLKLFVSKLTTLDLGIIPNLETLSLYQCTDMVELQIPAECSKLLRLELNYLMLTTLRFRITPNLETLRLNNCTHMVELQIPAECSKLVNLEFDNLVLTTLRLGITPNLKTLRLNNCTDMVALQIPAECPKLVNLDLSNLKLRTLHLGITPNLETLRLRDCTDMVELHMPSECPKLVDLDLSNLKLRTLHLGITPNLETLRLNSCTDMVELQIPAECPKLVNLDLDNLKLRTLHLGNTSNLETLRLNNCTDMVELQILAECPKLVNLDLINLKLRTFHLGITPNLETLSVSQCTDMVKLRMPTECPKLVTLDLNNVMVRTLDLGPTPSLERLNLEYCCDLEEINAPAECLKKLRHLDISHCGRFDSFVFEDTWPKLVSLFELHLIAVKTGACDPSNTWPEFQFTCYYIDDSASSFENLERLVSLGFGARINVDFLSDIMCGLQCLRMLTLEGGIPEVPKNLDGLDCLEELSLRSTDIKTLPDSICMLKHLKSLKLESCLLLEKLPVDIGRLECLERLVLFDCTLLQDIPNSICEMKRLEHLELSYCIRVEKLPEEFGRLKCLKDLNIQGTWISHLPYSIFGLKGLRVVGDRWSLEACGLTRKARRTSYEDDETFCYI